MTTERDIVIVTGSSGYIGSTVVQQLAGDYRILGFDREAPPHPPREAECICIDLTDLDSVRAALEVKNARYIRSEHLRALAGFGEDYPQSRRYRLPQKGALRPKRRALIPRREFLLALRPARYRVLYHR